MKPFATKAEMLAENPDTGVKTYVIDWIDGHGTLIKSKADGKNMSEALKVVLRQELRHKIENVPMWAYLVLAVSIIATFAVVAVASGAPLVSIMGGVFGITSLYLLIERYFKYTK